MNASLTQGYTEEINFDKINPEEFIEISSDIGAELGWEMIERTGYLARYKTQGSPTSYEEIITISAYDTSGTVMSMSASEYLYSQQQNVENVQLFKQLFAKYLSSGPVVTNIAVQKDAAWKALLPSKKFLITPILVYLNTLVFILVALNGVSVFDPTAAELLSWGGNFRPVTINGEYWRLLTYSFLHAGILHLLMNMYALLFVGIQLEPILGKLRFAAGYVFTAMGAGLLSMSVHSYSVAVGASGAVFGLYGIFLALLTTKVINKHIDKSTIGSILFFIGFNLLYGLQGNIDNAAHIGGLLGGLVIGYTYFPGIWKEHPRLLQIRTVAILAIASILLTAFAVRNLSNDLLVYEQKMKQFTDMEAMALEAYNLNTPDTTELLYNIKDRGIYYWNENKQIIKDLKKLDLPEHLSARNDKLERYCDLRIRNYELIYNFIKGTDTTTRGEIEMNDNQIQMLINDIKGIDAE